MLIKISLLKKSFFFLDGLNLKRADGEVEVELSTKTDAFKATIARSISSGILRSDTDPSEVLSLIEDNLFKDNLKAVILPIGNDFIDVVESEVEIMDVEVEEVIAPPEAEQIDAAVDGKVFDILKGTNKSVSAKIRTANLSDSDKETLLNREISTKNRTVIKKLLGA